MILKNLKIKDNLWKTIYIYRYKYENKYYFFFDLPIKTIYSNRTEIGSNFNYDAYKDNINLFLSI